MPLALTAFHLAIIFIAGSIFVAAAVHDSCSYRIPNYMCGLLLALYPFFVLTAPYPVDWKQSLAIFALVVVAGFAMFLGKLAGAGDVKLLAAASLWAGPHLIAVLLIVTAIAGGVVSIFMAIAVHRRKQAEHLTKVPIPYGVAIATGGVTVLGMMVQPILIPG
jgi:prepilin peptidase CpaA